MGDVERMGHLLRFLQVVKMRGTRTAALNMRLANTRSHADSNAKWGAVSDKTNDGVLIMYELDQKSQSN